MFKFIRSLFSRKGRRSSERAHIIGLTCKISLPDGQSFEAIPIFDLSISGLSFTMKTDSLQITQKVNFHIVSQFGSSVVQTGQIASQRIYYPNYSGDLKDALYRFSAKFDSPISRFAQLLNESAQPIS